MIRSADSAEKEEATHRLRTNLIVMGHEQPLESRRHLKTIRRQPFRNLQHSSSRVLDSRQDMATA